MNFDTYIYRIGFQWYHLLAAGGFGFMIGVIVTVFYTDTVYEDKKTLKRWLKNGKSKR